jgi:hypothetical protein
MENWNKQLHDFGKVSKGATLKTEFEYIGIKQIKEIEPLCSCIGYKLTGNCLELKWNVKKSPVESYQSNKVVMVTYADDAIDDLTLTAYIQV